MNDINEILKLIQGHNKKIKGQDQICDYGKKHVLTRYFERQFES